MSNHICQRFLDLGEGGVFGFFIAKFLFRHDIQEWKSLSIFRKVLTYKMNGLLEL